jgi:hypothetical protein
LHRVTRIAYIEHLTQLSEQRAAARAARCARKFTKGSQMGNLTVVNSKVANSIVRAASATLLLSMMYFSAHAQMTISGTPPATATVGEEYSFVPIVENANEELLQFAYLGRPSWSNDYRKSGAIVGTPTAPGIYPNIQIQAWDGEHFAVTAPFTITVLAAGTTAPPPGAAGTTVSWSKPTQNVDGTPLTNLAGYVVRYGSSPGALTEQIPVSSPNSTSLEIDNLSPGNWYFEVATVNTANMESQFSSVVSEAIP